LFCVELIDTIEESSHFDFVKSLLEIEEAIAKLPPKARRQLVKDIPALCPNEFPADGWDAILNDDSPRPAFSSLLDNLDAEHSQSSEKFLVMNDKSLRAKK
jgi:hypothetical protein